MGLNLDIPGIGNNGKKKKKRKGASSSVRIQILREQEDKCKKCEVKFEGGGITEVIHHKDGDRENRKRSNLVALCRNCHDIEDKKLEKRKKSKEKRKQSKDKKSKDGNPFSVPDLGLDKDIIGL